MYESGSVSVTREGQINIHDRQYGVAYYVERWKGRCLFLGRDGIAGAI